MFFVNEDALVSIMEKESIILKGHFLLTSGRHSIEYINKDAIYCNPKIFSEIMTNLKSILYCFEPYKVITGPAIAGAVLAAPMALMVNKVFMYPEKKIIKNVIEGETVFKKIMEFRQIYKKAICGKKVIIVEDIITTGGSINQTIETVNLCGGKVVGIIAIWNRERWIPPTRIKLISLINQPIKSWEPEECPLCKECWVSLIDIKTGLKVYRDISTEEMEMENRGI